MRTISIRLVVIFYSALMLAALLWTWVRGDGNPFVHPTMFKGFIDSSLVLHGLALGALSAGALIVASRLSAQYFAWARDLEKEFAGLLGRLSIADILIIALFSGVAEEAFFRGALQPTIGWTMTTLLFGMLHIGPSRRFIPWTISAILVGGMLGLYFDRTGILAAPIACHVLVNAVNLFFISRRAD